jgi:hypothetical protein
VSLFQHRATDESLVQGGTGWSFGHHDLQVGLDRPRAPRRPADPDPRRATSNIDRPTEILIERALDTLLSGRTSIIIAHRLSTVRRADEILVVEHGRITQRGTERELLAREGPFRRLAHDLRAAEQRPAPPRPATRAPVRS